ncbi:MAG: tetratricopeptide repeat protein [Flavobacterium sp.]
MEQKKENTQILADSAFEAENYDLAYNYYNRLLEDDLENAENWLRKGYCAVHLSKFDRMLDKEVLMSIKTAKGLTSFDKDRTTKIANEISTILFDKIVESVKFIQSEIDREFNAIQILPGTLHAVHNLRKVSIQLKVWGNYSEKLFQYFKVMDYVVRMSPNAITCEKGYRSVNYTNTVSSHSGEHFYKLEGSSPESTLLRELRQFTKSELDRLLPGNEITNPKSTSGCFIATATMGNYDHPVVYELRQLRDNWLLNKSWGQNFTEWYYRNSPKVAEYIKDSTFLKFLTFTLVVFPLYCISKLIKKNGL